MVQIRLTPLNFYSLGDELALFRWIGDVKAVKRTEGSRNSFILYFQSSRISNKDLRELLGIFARHGFEDMAQLAQFRSKRNESWFADPGRYWHEGVFASH